MWKNIILMIYENIGECIYQFSSYLFSYSLFNYTFETNACELGLFVNY